MKKIGDVFKKEQLKRNISKKEKRDDSLYESWKNISGESCFKHTKQLNLKNGILYVVLESKAWQQELLLKDTDIMAAQMAKETGLNIVKIKVNSGKRFIV
jgi:predicted nucleic acid-binding Zn ribbon protein